MTRWWAAGVAAAALIGPGVVKGEVAEAALQKPAAAAKKLRSLQEATGRVRTVDRDRNELTISEGEASPVILLVDKATTIFVDGRIGSLQDVREGFVVRASYDVKQGQNRAQWVEISKREPERQAPVTHGRKK